MRGELRIEVIMGGEGEVITMRVNIRAVVSIIITGGAAGRGEGIPRQGRGKGTWEYRLRTHCA